jgi:PhnB protein
VILKCGGAIPGANISRGMPLTHFSKMNFTPYLLFNGNCAEAMHFYKSALGGDLTVMKVSNSPMKDFMPPKLQNLVINSRLKSGPIEFSASDWLHPGRNASRGNMVCLYLSEGGYEDLKAYFDKLSQGADRDLMDPLTKRPFGFYGAFTDKFGVRWMFHGSA